MDFPEFSPRDGFFTGELSSIDPDAAKLRRKVNEILNKEALESRQQLAAKGNIWGLVSIIPSEFLLDNRDLLIQAAANREQAKEGEPTMRYATFIRCVKTAITPEEVLYAIPTEWIGKTIYQKINSKVK